MLSYWKSETIYCQNFFPFKGNKLLYCCLIVKKKPTKIDPIVVQLFVYMYDPLIRLIQILLSLMLINALII